MAPIPKILALRYSAAILLLHLHLLASAAALTTDGLALLALKSAISSDPTAALASWSDASPTPCAWPGVTCRSGRVAALLLPNLSLAGYLPSELSLLSDLHSLSLPNNLLSGPLPALDLPSLSTLDLSSNNLSGTIPTNLRSLTTLDLSNNALTGQIPAVIAGMKALSFIDLSSNHFSGNIPPSISTLSNLSGVLNLSHNALSGQIPPEFGSIPVTVSLDLRANNLSGEIPPVGTLLNQGPTAFAGNPNLCGFPLKNPCPASLQDPSVPHINPEANPSNLSGDGDRTKKKSAPTPAAAAAIPVLVGVVIVAVVSVLVLQWRCRRRRMAAEDKKGGECTVAPEWREGRSGEVYMTLDEGFGLELEELLRASAYVVGKSRSGIVYRVVVARGNAVAVRRLSEAEDGGECEDEWRRRRAFETEAAAIGRAKHPNVVALRAYYYAPDEKLLVYDYIAGGTLHAALHGGQLNPVAPPPLLWAVRLSILRGAARGLAYIHECSPRKHVHGSFKSSKILLDEEHRPYISGFGLNRITSVAHKFSHSASKKLSSGSIPAVDPRNPSAIGYIAPEARSPGSTMTQKCDVYAFGIVLLEALTGQSNVGEGELEGSVRRAFKEERPLSEVVDAALLHEVYAKKEVLAVFHVALGCTEADPEARPRMKAVSESLDRVGAGH